MNETKKRLLGVHRFCCCFVFQTHNLSFDYIIFKIYISCLHLLPYACRLLIQRGVLKTSKQTNKIIILTSQSPHLISLDRNQIETGSDTVVKYLVNISKKKKKQKKQITKQIIKLSSTKSCTLCSKYAQHLFKGDNKRSSCFITKRKMLVFSRMLFRRGL